MNKEAPVANEALWRDQLRMFEACMAVASRLGIVIVYGPANEALKEALEQWLLKHKDYTQ